MCLLLASTTNRPVFVDINDINDIKREWTIDEPKIEEQPARLQIQSGGLTARRPQLSTFTHAFAPTSPPLRLVDFRDGARNGKP